MLYDKFDYVLAVAEERNLTKAAQRLYVSQPTLTMYLNRLEEELGVKLFDRTRSPIVITDAGRFYLQKMTQISAAERTMRQELQDITHPAQSLSVGIGQNRGNHWLPLILPEFCRLFPNVNIYLVQQPEDVLYQRLQQQQIDLVIGAYPAVDQEFTVEELMFEKLFLAASRSFGIVPADIRDQSGPDLPYCVRPERLRGMPLIMPAPGHGMHPIFDNIIQKYHLSPSRIISISNMGAGIRLTASGLGVQLLSGPAIDQLPGFDPKTLDYFIIRGMPEFRRCIAIYRPESVKLEQIRAFLRIARARAIPACSGCVLP